MHSADNNKYRDIGVGSTVVGFLIGVFIPSEWVLGWFIVGFVLAYAIANFAAHAISRVLHDHEVWRRNL
ncbi:MAG TPA: hypothetical protein DGG94_19410 [Micromonosporaceae bacterium]|nr:hypothetical protein [Micromonosporaceae bacterium]HCU51937.1 hypothetical protein [Micromonosporaceae bacterium]